MKKNIIASIVVSTALLTVPFYPAYELAASKNFSDIDNSFAKDAIKKLQDAGIISGYGDGSFNPLGSITREEFAKILVLANGVDISNTPKVATFSDVSTTSWAFPYIEAAVKAGYIKGYNDGTFKGGTNLSREDMAVLFVRSLGVDATGYASKLNFSDKGSISSYAKDAVAYALEAGLINGGTNGSFNPRDNATREQVAKVANLFLQAKDELKNPQPDPTTPPDPQTPIIPKPSGLTVDISQDGKFFVDLDWKPSSEVTRYDVYVSNTSNFSDAVLDGQGEVWTDSNDTKHGFYRFEYSENEIKDYYYFVVAITSKGKSEPEMISVSSKDFQDDSDLPSLQFVKKATLNLLLGESIPISTFPSLEDLTAEPSDNGELTFTFQQDQQTGGKGLYDFAMSNATIEFNQEVDSSKSYTTYLTHVTGQSAEEMFRNSDKELGNSFVYGDLVFTDGEWILTPIDNPQTFQTPGTFTLQTTVQDNNGKETTFNVILVITSAFN